MECKRHAFKGRYKDFIDQVQVRGTFTPADPAIYQFINRGRVSIKGVEARGQAAFGDGFGLNVAAAYARGDSTVAGVKTPLDSVDPLKLVAGLTWRQAQGRFGGQVNVTHASGKDRGRAGGACAPNCFTPAAFTIVDVTAFWTVSPSATLRAGVFNLMIIWTFRAVAVGRWRCPMIEREYRCACGPAGDGARNAVGLFAHAVQARGRRPVTLARPEMLSLTRDEQLLLAIYAAAQARDPDRCRAHLAWLLAAPAPETLYSLALVTAQAMRVHGHELREVTVGGGSSRADDRSAPLKTA